MRILPVQSLSGIASLMIIILLFKNDSFWHQNVLVLKSAVFVDFFFVLSGFVIALNYLGAEDAQLFMQIPQAVGFVFQGLVLFYLLGADLLVNYKIVFKK